VNRRCPRCGWQTLSFISLGYRYCPMCASPLEEFNMSAGREFPDEEGLDVKYYREVSRSIKA